MKLKIYSIITIAAVIICEKSTTSSSTDDITDAVHCFKSYLQDKGKLPYDDPSELDAYDIQCRFRATNAITGLLGDIEEIVKSENPCHSKCLFDEFKNEEIVDVIVKLAVVQRSELSKTEMKTQIYESRIQLKNHLINIANECDTEPGDFVKIFNEYLGIKEPRNVTLSAVEHNYCFAQYAAANDFLPLDNIELNPFGIEALDVDCDTIIQEEQDRVKDIIHKQLTEILSPKSVACAESEYEKANYFQVHITTQVLKYLDFPPDVEEAERLKLADRLSNLSPIPLYCYVAVSNENKLKN